MKNQSVTVRVDGVELGSYAFPQERDLQRIVVDLPPGPLTRQVELAYARWVTTEEKQPRALALLYRCLKVVPAPLKGDLHRSWDSVPPE